MKKILLTSTLIGAAFVATTYASAQSVKFSSSVSGNVGISIKGLFGDQADPKLNSYLPDYGRMRDTAFFDMPNFQNKVVVSGSGEVQNLGLSFGGKIQFRPLAGTGTDVYDSGGAGSGKAYAGNNASSQAIKVAHVFIGQRWAGTLTLGKDYGINTDSFTDGTYVLPGYGQYGEETLNNLFAESSIDISKGDTSLKLKYSTPTIAGVYLGYSFTPEDKNGVKNVHEAAVRYDGEFGPVTFAAQLGYLGTAAIDTATQTHKYISDYNHVAAYTVGAEVGYADGKYIGVNLAGGFRNYNNITAGSQINSWSVGLGLSTPYVSGLSLGVTYGSATATEKTDDTITVGNVIGVGLGYAWSDNFSSTLWMDYSLGGDAEGNTTYSPAGGVWGINHQLSF